MTENELQDKRERNAKAQEELRELNEQRVAAELAEADELAAQKLDAEYEQIQAAIAQARALNAQAVDKTEDKAPAIPPVPKPENSAPAVNAEGK